jgi:hypothetical protein
MLTCFAVEMLAGLGHHLADFCKTKCINFKQELQENLKRNYTAGKHFGRIHSGKEIFSRVSGLVLSKQKSSSVVA